MATAALATPSLVHHAFGIGHRGARLLTKENTIAGFRKCVEIGINMIEFDINITADNVLVVYHDVKMEDDKVINEMTLAEFQAYDSDFPTLESMLSDEVLIRSDILFYFDIKDSLVTAPLMHHLHGIILKDPTFAVRCYVASFTPEDIATAVEIRSAYPELRDVRIGGIYEDEDMHHLVANPCQVYPAQGINFLSLKSCLATKELVKECHDHNLLVFSWTLNTEEECERMRHMEIDGYCGDDVSLLMKFQVRDPASVITALTHNNE